MLSEHNACSTAGTIIWICKNYFFSAATPIFFGVGGAVLGIFCEKKLGLNNNMMHWSTRQRIRVHQISRVVEQIFLFEERRNCKRPTRLLSKFDKNVEFSSIRLVQMSWTDEFDRQKFAQLYVFIKFSSDRSSMPETCSFAVWQNRKFWLKFVRFHLSKVEIDYARNLIYSPTHWSKRWLFCLNSSFSLSFLATNCNTFRWTTWICGEPLKA